MDELQIQNLIQRCKFLKHRFRGVFAADNFPPSIPDETFLIANASKSNLSGTHWLLLCKRNGCLYFADTLGFPVEAYKDLYYRLLFYNVNVNELMKNNPMQPDNSNLCALYCVYIAFIRFQSQFPVNIPYIKDFQLIQFVNQFCGA